MDFHLSNDIYCSYVIGCVWVVAVTSH